MSTPPTITPEKKLLAALDDAGDRVHKARKSIANLANHSMSGAGNEVFFLAEAKHAVTFARRSLKKARKQSSKLLREALEARKNL